MDHSELVEQAQAYANGFWRYRWHAFSIACVVCVLGWTLVLSMPDRFEASARIYVDTETVLRPLLKGLVVETDVMSDVSLISRTMLNRPSLERVIRDVDLDLTAKTASEFEALVESVKNRLDVAKQGTKTNTYLIRFTDRDQTTALEVVKTLLDDFMEGTLGSGESDSMQAEAAIKDQIEEYERRLREAEDKLATFKQENVGLMSDNRSDYYADLQSQTEAAAVVRQQVNSMEHRIRALALQLEGEEPVFGIMPSSLAGGGQPTSYDAQIEQLEARRTDLLIEFTDRHPEVVRVTNLLNDLQQKRDEELANRPLTADINPATGALDLNPVYQQIKIQHNTVRVELTSLKAELADRERAIRRLREQVDVIPEVQAQLGRLNRDYDVVQSRYQIMLERWENLQTSKRVKSDTDAVHFRIIDPPFAELWEIPRRSLIIAAYLAALGIGIGVAILLAQLNPVFSNRRDARTTGIPVLGEISMISQAGQQANWIQNSGAFIIAVIALSSAAILVTSVSNLGGQLLQRLLA